MRGFLLLPAVVLLLVLPVQAATDKPERVSNERYSFAFTVEASSTVTYEKGGVGFSCTHRVGGTPDYGLLVFGSPYVRLSAADAEAAKLAPKEEGVLAASEAGDNKKWAESFSAINAVRKRKAAGQAKLKLPDGGSFSAPYFTWDQTVLSQTHYALTYVVVHGDSFISVQAESSKPFTKAQTEWITTKLELVKLQPPAVTPAP